MLRGFGEVATAGNGCYTMIGWLHHLLSRDDFALEQQLSFRHEVLLYNMIYIYIDAVSLFLATSPLAAVGILHTLNGRVQRLLPKGSDSGSGHCAATATRKPSYICISGFTRRLLTFVASSFGMNSLSPARHPVPVSEDDGDTLRTSLKPRKTPLNATS